MPAGRPARDLEASLAREREKVTLRIQPAVQPPTPASKFAKTEMTADSTAAAWDSRRGASIVFCAAHRQSQIPSTRWRCPSDSCPAIRESENRYSASQF